jgi:fucose 4-O-acetylase-like acetyltransferase
MWFLPALFLLSVLFMALWKLGAGNMGRISALVACCGLAGILLSRWLHQPIPWHLPTVLTALIFYYAGYLFMKYRERLTARIANRPALLLGLIVALFAAGTFFALVNGKVSMHNNQYKTVPFFFLSAFLLSAAVILGVSRLRTFKWLAYLGQNTLVSLAIHIPMLRTIQNFSPAGLRLTYNYPVIVGVVVFIATIPFTMLVNRFAPFLVARKYPDKTPPGRLGGSG